MGIPIHIDIEHTGVPYTSTCIGAQHKYTCRHTAQAHSHTHIGRQHRCTHTHTHRHTAQVHSHIGRCTQTHQYIIQMCTEPWAYDTGPPTHRHMMQVYTHTTLY